MPWFQHQVPTSTTDSGSNLRAHVFSMTAPRYDIPGHSALSGAHHRHKLLMSTWQSKLEPNARHYRHPQEVGTPVLVTSYLAGDGVSGWVGDMSWQTSTFWRQGRTGESQRIQTYDTSSPRSALKTSSSIRTFALGMAEAQMQQQFRQFLKLKEGQTQVKSCRGTH